MVEVETTFVVAGQGERRTGDRLRHAQGGTESLGERRLSGTEFAGQQDQVAGAGEFGQGGGQGPGLVDGT